MLKAFTYRLYPNHGQIESFEAHLRLTRELYNAALEERREAYRKVGKSVSVYEQMRSLPEVKEGRPEFKKIHAHVLQNVVQKLDRAFQAFFRRVKTVETPGYPRFKGRDGWNSFAFKQVWDTPGNRWFGPGKPLENGRIYLPNIGNVKMRLHRPLEGKPKTLTIKREADQWFAVYSCEVEAAPLKPTGSVIGVDLGTNPNFLITSDGEFVPAPRHYIKAQAKLRREQRSLSKKKRNSSQRRKAKKRVAKLHHKTARQRKDFHHKTARALVNQHDTIFHENLNIIGLARMKAAKGVLDAGWSQFLNILSLKAASAARRVAGVNPAYTSQDCSRCRHRSRVSIGQPYICAACGLKLNRDVNAALNILRLGQGLPLDEGNAVARLQRLQKPPALAVGRIT